MVVVEAFINLKNTTHSSPAIYGYAGDFFNTKNPAEAGRRTSFSSEENFVHMSFGRVLGKGPLKNPLMTNITCYLFIYLV